MQREEFQAQVPNWFPVDEDAVVIVSGIVELVLGAALIVTGRRRAPIVGVVVAGFFIVIFPGNIGQLIDRADAFGLDSDAKRAVRLFSTGARALGAVVHRRLDLAPSAVRPTDRRRAADGRGRRRPRAGSQQHRDLGHRLGSPKPCSASQRTLLRQRIDHHPAISRGPAGAVAAHHVVEVLRVPEREGGEVEERVAPGRLGPVDDAGDLVVGWRTQVESRSPVAARSRNRTVARTTSRRRPPVT